MNFEQPVHGLKSTFGFQPILVLKRKEAHNLHLAESVQTESLSHAAGEPVICNRIQWHAWQKCYDKSSLSISFHEPIRLG